MGIIVGTIVQWCITTETTGLGMLLLRVRTGGGGGGNEATFVGASNGWICPGLEKEPGGLRGVLLGCKAKWSRSRAGPSVDIGACLYKEACAFCGIAVSGVV